MNMRTRSIAGVILALSCAGLVGALDRTTAQSQTRDTSERTAALETFTFAIQRYASLRARLEKPLPPFDPRRDPWSLRLQRHYLASAIRTARKEATVGSVFDVSVGAVFRHDIATAIREVDIEGLVTEGEDIEVDLVDLTVNEFVPVWAMRPVPDVLAERLPPLPEAVEYRLVADALILWDTRAEILIDALPGALAAPLSQR
jgi:hypothetical protein